MMAKDFASSPVHAHAAHPARRTGSTGMMKQPVPHKATMGNRRRWSAWQDWVSVVLGIYFLLAPLWIPGAPPAVFMTLGALIIVASLWAGTTASSTLAEFTKMVLGALVIVSALFSAHVEERTAMLNSWMIGAALILLSVIASYRNRSGRSTTNPHEYQFA